MSNWTGRLKAKMKELSLTQEELARKLGVTRSAVAHYVQGTRHPPLRQVIKLAAVLKTDPAWLQFGKAQATGNPSSKNIKKNAHRIPILNWSQVKDFSPDYLQNKYEYLDYFNSHHAECYALQIKGDAMVSTMNQGISFNQGSYVVVNPNQLPTHGSFVVIATNKKEAILRQYVEEGGTVYLKPLNPQYPLIELERSIKIVGLVIANIHII